METMKYEQALSELEAIAGKLENGDIDIDSLAGQIKRAKELIKLCNDRLHAVGEEIKSTGEEEA